MNASHLLRAALSGLLSAAPAAAGTWIVDDDGGADFTDLPPAIAAAAPGDLILVRDGDYSSFILDFGLVIAADSGAEPVLTDGTIWIRDLPAGHRVVISGLLLEGLRVQACDGPVHVDDCTIEHGHLFPAVSVVASELVLLSRLTVRGASGSVKDMVFPPSMAQRGADLRNSTVVATQCLIQGGMGGTKYKSDGEPGEPALRAENATVVLQSCTLRGGLGGNGWKILNELWSADGGDAAPAVHALGSDVRIFGAGDLVQGGDGGFPNIGELGVSAPGLQVDDSDVSYSGVSIAGGWLAPPIAGNGTVTEVLPAVPVLVAVGDAQLGGSLTLTLTGPARAPFALLASTVPAHVPVGIKPMPLVLEAPLGTLLIGALDGAGQFSVPLALPAWTALQGLPVQLQPFVKPAGGPSTLGTAASFVVR